MLRSFHLVSEQGGYVIWGTAAIRKDDDTYPQDYTTYRIELGPNGELTDEVLGAYSGTCVAYKSGQVYVANTDTLPYVSLDMFKESFGESNPSYAVEKRYDIIEKKRERMDICKAY